VRQGESSRVEAILNEEFVSDRSGERELFGASNLSFEGRSESE
jgi:hypothetical protein